MPSIKPSAVSRESTPAAPHHPTARQPAFGLNTRRALTLIQAHTVTGLIAATCGCVAAQPIPTKPPAASTAPRTPAAAIPTAPGTRPAMTPHGGLPNPRRIDATDPTEVSRAALTCLWLVDTAIDRSPRDAAQRAAPYLTPAYAGQLDGSPAQVADPAWARHLAYAHLRLSLAHDDGSPQDTATEAYRQWRITITPVGRDRWRGYTIAVIAFATLTRTGPGQPWRVAGISVS